MTRVYTLMNQKGGVGKTTSTIQSWRVSGATGEARVGGGFRSASQCHILFGRG